MQIFRKLLALFILEEESIVRKYPSLAAILESFKCPEQWENIQNIGGPKIQTLYTFANVVVHCYFKEHFCRWSYNEVRGRGFAIIEPMAEDFDEQTSEFLTIRFKKMISVKNERKIKEALSYSYTYSEYEDFVEELIKANKAYALTSPNDRMRKLAEKLLSEGN